MVLAQADPGPVRGDRRRVVAAGRAGSHRPAGRVDPKRLDELALDGGFLERVDQLAEDLDTYLTRPLWYQERQAAGDGLPSGIAYFSMEFASPRSCRTTRVAWVSSPVIT